MGRYSDNLNGTSYDQKQNATVTSLDTKVDGLDTKVGGLITQGTTAPSAKPAAKNLLYFDKTTQKLYVSTGTSESTDWVEVKAVAIV